MRRGGPAAAREGYPRRVLSPYRIAAARALVEPTRPKRDLGALRSKHDGRPAFVLTLVVMMSVAFWIWMIAPKTCAGAPTGIIIAAVGFGFTVLSFVVWTLSGCVYRLHDFGIARQGWFSKRTIHFDDVHSVHYRNLLAALRLRSSHGTRAAPRDRLRPGPPRPSDAPWEARG